MEGNREVEWNGRVEWNWEGGVEYLYMILISFLFRLTVV